MVDITKLTGIQLNIRDNPHYPHSTEYSTVQQEVVVMNFACLEQFFKIAHQHFKQQKAS